MIDGTTPPAPSIKIFLSFISKFISLIAFLKPSISVLCPKTLLLLRQIVLTDCVFFASGLKLSIKEITSFLKGTVTFIPSIFFL